MTINNITSPINLKPKKHYNKIQEHKSFTFFASLKCGIGLETVNRLTEYFTFDISKSNNMVYNCMIFLL
jgi:hypothetical protein